MKKSYEQLEARQKGLTLAKSVYEVTINYPSDQKNGLVSQMRSAALSIPSIIAEGAEKQTDKDAKKYFVVARGYLSQLDTHFVHSRSLGMIDGPNYQNIQTQIETINSLLSGLIHPRRAKNRRDKS
jgi:four helix bundle protein